MTRSVLARAGSWILDGQAGMSKEGYLSFTNIWDDEYLFAGNENIAFYCNRKKIRL